MKKLIIPFLAAVAIASLSGCTTVKETKETPTPSTTTTTEQSTVPSSTTTTETQSH